MGHVSEIPLDPPDFKMFAMVYKPLTIISTTRLFHEACAPLCSVLVVWVLVFAWFATWFDCMYIVGEDGARWGC